MKSVLDQKIFDEAKTQVCAMIDENMERIVEARNATIIASAEAGAEGPTKFSFGLTVVQVPRGGEVNVYTKISFTVAHKDETEPVTVSNQQELPFDSIKKDGGSVTMTLSKERKGEK